MKRSFILALAVICAGSLSLNSAQSAVPQLINYQGILTDGSGDPVVDGAYQVKFTIWDASAAGADQWNSGFQNIVTTDGLFEYILGSNVDLPDDIFADTIRYLGITVGIDAEITPRTRLVSAGYAYHALRSDVAIIAKSVVSNSIGSAEVIDNSLTAADLATNSVGALEIATDAVRSPEIAAGAVGSSEVLDNSLRDFDILDEPGVAQFATGNPTVVSSDDPTIISTRIIDCPTSGFVLAIVSFELIFTHVNGATSSYNFWLSQATSQPSGQEKNFVWSLAMPTAPIRQIISINHIFTVASGNQTINFVVDRSPGDPDYTLDDITLSLMFFPTAYGTVTTTPPAGEENENEATNDGANGGSN